MDFEVRWLRRSDVTQVVSGWNKCLPYDRLNEERFESTIFKDPNYEKEGNLVAALNNRIGGFVAAVAREGIAGRDGKGRIDEKDFGYIKGLFVLDEYRGEGIETCLLERAMRFLKSKGKKMVRVGEYAGRYFFPGIDTRYEEELRFYRENGFEEIDTEEDVMLDLTTFQPTEYQRQAQRRIEELGVVIKPYKAEFLDKMRLFAKRLNYPQWFSEGWESDSFFHPGLTRGYTLVALCGSEIIGWAEFHQSYEGWSFGPIAVLKELRGRGIGTCLLLQSVLRMKALGTPNVTAGWANAPFYLKNGWKISRRYIVFQKNL